MKEHIAILIPCHNQEQTIEKVVTDFKVQLPTASIYIYDNNSTDHTLQMAKHAGALIGREYRQGKAHVVRRMFSDIEADIYVLVDGDDTYDANSIHSMLMHMKQESLDMMVGARTLLSAKKSSHRLFCWAMRVLCQQQVEDIFSGYRIFSKRFVKSFPCFADDFAIEMEMTVHALEMNLSIGELPIPYGDGTLRSQLDSQTHQGRAQTLWSIVRLFKRLKPKTFFSYVTLFLSLINASFVVFVMQTSVTTGTYPCILMILLIFSLAIIAVISFFSGLILHNIVRARLEFKRLHYLLS